MQLKYLSLVVLFFIAGCGYKIAPKNQALVYANDCSQPRETIILYPNGRGEVHIKGQVYIKGRAAPLIWEKKGGYLHISQIGRDNTVIAHYDSQGNLILQSLSTRKEKDFGHKERIRYLCNLA